MVGVFPHVLVRDREVDLFLNLRSRHFCVLVFGTLGRIFALVCMVAVSGLYPSTDENEEKYFFSYLGLECVIYTAAGNFPDIL